MMALEKENLSCLVRDSASVYNKAVIKKTDHHKSDVENKKWGARTGGLRVSGRFNPEPDLDNANVGR